MIKRKFLAANMAVILAATFAPTVYAAGAAKNIIFFLGDGMGPAVVTAARIYKGNGTGKNEAEVLAFQSQLDRTARIKTYSHDGQTTDSAPSMGSYMTGVKANNEVISMSADTIASGANKPSNDANSNLGINNCPASGNGTSVVTILELAKKAGKGTGSITTTELTHATPAATFSHICNRNAQYHIAAQLVPNGLGYNKALSNGTDLGVDVLMGGGLNHFTPWVAGTGPGTNSKGRADGRDLTAELALTANGGYTVAKTKAEMDAAPLTTKKFIGLYSTTSHLAYELDRKEAVAAVAANNAVSFNFPATMSAETVDQTQAATQPSLSDMTVKSIQLLSQNANGYFLMVEGGRIDHALHNTNAKRALEDTVAFDDAIAAAITEIKKTDPALTNTLIVVTADHDHTMTINGYGRIGNPILDINRSYNTAVSPDTDSNGVNYTTLVFGNGYNRPNVARTSLTTATVTDKDYLQEAGVRKGAGGESHGGGDVMLYATGAGSELFKGTMDNTKVFTILKTAFGL
jgi:alkaline phosphatase